MDPREILDETRKAISDCAGNDPDKWFYANRFVFARLQLDERRTKTQVKKDLLAAGKPSHYCREPIDNKVGIHLHRRDGNRGYSADNCVLMHGECHTSFRMTLEAPLRCSAHSSSLDEIRHYYHTTNKESRT